MRKHRTSQLPPPHLLLLENGLLGSLVGSLAGLIVLGVLVAFDSADPSLMSTFLVMAAFTGSCAAGAIAVRVAIRGRE